MIEKMKVVHIVAAQTQKTELLDALRALGIVHFAEKVDATRPIWSASPPSRGSSPCSRSRG